MISGQITGEVTVITPFVLEDFDSSWLVWWFPFCKALSNTSLWACAWEALLFFGVKVNDLNPL